MVIELINNLLKESMRDKNESKLSVLRMLKSTIRNKEIDKKENLSEDETVNVIYSEIKKRKESAAIYEKAARLDLFEKEKLEANILAELLPEQMSSEDLELIVRQTISELGASGRGDIGRVMSAVMPKVSGKASGSDVSKKVSQLLV